MQTHPQAFRHYKQEEVYICSQSIETHRHARVVSGLVRNTNTKGQLLIGAMYLQTQRVQPRMKDLQCISPALMLAEALAKSQIHLYHQLYLMRCLWFQFANMQRRLYSGSLHDTHAGNEKITFLPSNHDHSGFVDWQAYLTVIMICSFPCFALA